MRNFSTKGRGPSVLTWRELLDDQEVPPIVGRTDPWKGGPRLAVINVVI